MSNYDRIYIEGWALALTFGAVDQAVAEHWIYSAICALLSAFAQFTVIKWRVWLNSNVENKLILTMHAAANDGRWWLVTICVFLLFIGISLNAEQRYWSYEYFFKNREIPSNIVNAFDRSYDPALGNSTSDIQASAGFSYAGYDNAIVFWGMEDTDLVFLSKNPNKRTTIYEPIPDQKEGCKYNNDNAMRKIFHLDEGKFPPIGGVAMLREGNSDWDWVGNREFQFHYAKNKIYFQLFEHGRIVGPLNVNNQASVVFVMPDGKNEFLWRSRRVDAPPVTPDQRAPFLDTPDSCQ